MKLQRMNKRSRAFTAIDLMLVIVLVAVQVALVAPMFVHPRCGCIRINCASNLKQVGLAYRVWEGDNGDHYPMRGFTNELGVSEVPKPSNMFRYFQVMSNELSNPKILICPADNRTEATNFTLLKNTNLSYFVGLDADETQPTMLLGGDRNLVFNGFAVRPGVLTLLTTNRIEWSGTIHKQGGNVLMADGSVQQVTSSGLQAAIAHSGTNVNRLAVP
jgi:prepilin-type processing-associated H-X9-DG protein